MTTKEAIAIINKEWIHQQLETYRTCAERVIIDALIASQKREREVFKALRDSCEHYGNFSGECHYERVSRKCTRRTCPLLKQKKEVK